MPIIWRSLRLIQAGQLLISHQSLSLEVVTAACAGYSINLVLPAGM